MCARFLSFTSLDSTGLSTSLSRHTLLHGGSGHSGVTRLPWRREALQFEETVAPSERALAADFAQPLPSRSPPRSRSVSAAQLNGRSGSGVLIWNAVLDKNSVAPFLLRDPRGQDVRTANLDTHTAILDPHTAILDPHTAILDHDTAILDPHAAILDPHNAILRVPRSPHRDPRSLISLNRDPRSPHRDLLSPHRDPRSHTAILDHDTAIFDPHTAILDPHRNPPRSPISTPRSSVSIPLNRDPRCSRFELNRAVAKHNLHASISALDLHQDYCACACVLRLEPRVVNGRKASEAQQQSRGRGRGRGG